MKINQHARQWAGSRQAAAAAAALLARAFWVAAVFAATLDMNGSIALLISSRLLTQLLQHVNDFLVMVVGEA